MSNLALVRPTLLSVAAFDAKQVQKFAFTIQGASNQIVANQLTIYNQETNDIVYQEKQETFNYVHTVNAGELTNGTYYNATLSVFDANDNQSPESIPIQFWCYTTPVISFSNIPSTNIINNSSFDFQFLYTQTENEPINSYVINLFNSSQVQISTSGILYANNGTPPFTGNYTFTGFENNTVYYVQVTGTTTEGTVVNTGLQQFTVQYKYPDVFALAQLNNNCEEGYVTITSNFVLIKGESNPSPPIYINEEEVDLTSNGSWVQWSEGFNITGNMLARVWFRNPNNYTSILKFSNAQGQTITLNFMLRYENVESSTMGAYVEAYIESLDGFYYYIFSNYVAPLDDSEGYVLYFKRINDIYSLQLLTD